MIRSPSLLQLVLALGLFLFLAFSFTAWFDLPIQLLLFTGWFIMMAFGRLLGHDYVSMEKAALKSIGNGLGAIMILLSVGALVASWIAGGIVPAIIYYGLQLIHPSLFLISTLLICSFTSLATGTSWGSAATVGIAMMGVGYSLNIPLPLVTGAVLSGVYFGDKLSPLSDSVIITSTVTGVGVAEHIKGMLPISLLSYLITAVLFAAVGYGYGQRANMAEVELVSRALEATFNITPWSFVPVLAVLFLLMRRHPPMIVITFGALLGIVWAVVLQQRPLISALRSLYSPELIETNVVFIDSILTRGGMKSMLESVAVIIFGLGFGGLLKKVGFLDVLSGLVERYATTPARISIATLLVAFMGNLFGSAMYVALLLTPDIMAKHYDRMGISRLNLARNTEYGGTLTSAMVPWSDNGIYMSSLLGVPTLAYLPYMWFSISCILLTIVTACYGKLINFTQGDQAKQQES